MLKRAGLGLLVQWSVYYHIQGISLINGLWVERTCPYRLLLHIASLSQRHSGRADFETVSFGTTNGISESCLHISIYPDRDN
jgi:hypothetical protein